LLCRIAQVSRNGYYKYLKASVEADSDEKLSCIIRDLQGTKWETGYRPMTQLVSKILGFAVNRKRVLRIMREYGLLARVRRLRFPRDYYTTIKENCKQLPRNVLNRDIAVVEPRKVFVCDITYLPCREGWRYLHAVKDVFNKEIVAYRTSTHPDTQLCIDTVDDLDVLIDLSGTLIHSDQGSTYTSKAYRKLLSDLGVIQSMSRRGNCWDNYLRSMIIREDLLGAA
jgi:putative transposase